MSSRNAYLKPQERDRALGLWRALRAAGTAPDPSTAERRMQDTLQSHQLSIDYAVVRDAATLLPIQDYGQPARALIAARLGSVRLIDNAPVPRS
jgi:pantoate--beta-alanine ligase